jgi:hypothetical protein
MHRYRRGFDLTALSDTEAHVLVPALHACTFPTGRITNMSGSSVPVAVKDLSRFSASLDANGHGHAHESGEHAHLLGEPAPSENSLTRRAPLGLYWLPTAQFPVGRIEVGAAAMASPDLAREVLLAEAAHCVDYGAMTRSQRARIYVLMHDTPEHGPHGELPTELGPDDWFDIEGPYFSWPGERWMSMFISAYSNIPQPLESRQPWTHDFDESDLVAVRRILRRPSS